MKISTLTRLVMIVGLVLGMAGTARAVSMTVDLTAFISGKTAKFLPNTATQVGDTFALTFTYDDSAQTTRQAQVSGNLYTIVTQPFQVLGMTGWQGTLPQEIALNNPAFANGPIPGGPIPGWGVKQSWYRPLPTLHHDEWNIEVGGTKPFSFKLVTNFGGNLGYGWWAVGSNNAHGGATSSTIDYGFLTVTSLAITPTPPPTSEC